MLAAVDREDAVGRDAAALEAFVDETIRLARKHGYHPTEFLRMRSRYGTVGAISRLVRSGDIQSGFRRLTSLGLAAWTIEAAVVRFPGEFARADLECARFRLDRAGDASGKG